MAKVERTFQHTNLRRGMRTGPERKGKLESLPVHHCDKRVRILDGSLKQALPSPSISRRGERLY